MRTLALRRCARVLRCKATTRQRLAPTERVIVQANPPEKRGPKTEDNFVLQEDETLPASTLRNMRQAHARGRVSSRRTPCQLGSTRR